MKSFKMLLYKSVEQNNQTPDATSHSDQLRSECSKKYLLPLLDKMCIRDRPCIVEFSIPFGVGEDWLWERGSLPATFYVLTRVIFYMTNDNCRKFKQNQIIFCIQP